MINEQELLAKRAQQRYEYEICKKRGHQPSGFVTASIPPKDTCKWCGTRYWIDSQLRESGAPS